MGVTTIFETEMQERARESIHHVPADRMGEVGYRKVLECERGRR
jgi:hypothetical protein